MADDENDTITLSVWIETSPNNYSQAKNISWYSFIKPYTMVFLPTTYDLFGIRKVSYALFDGG